MSRPGPADDDRSLRSEDVDTIRGLFASGAADWALFGYVTPDDARCKLALLRTGTVRRDGPVEANLDPQAIIFGIFRVKVDTGESREEEFPGNSSSIEAKPGSDLRNAGDTEAPLVSFGFFGASSSITARTKWVSHRKQYEAQFTRAFGTRAHVELRKPSELDVGKIMRGLAERRDAVARKPSPFRVDTRCDLSDPSLRHVFESIHSEAELTNWMLCGYVTENKLEVVASGNDAIKALSSNPAEKVVGSVYEHLSHCGSRPMYLYLRLNGLPRASTLSTNPVVFSDGQSPGSGPLVAPRGSDWSFKGPDCASTYVLITWHAHGQDGLSKSTDSAAYGSLDSMSSSRSVGADVMRARAAIVAHASAVQKFFVHDIRYHAFCDEDISTERILKEVRRITHVDHFRITVEVFDGPGCPVAHRMKQGFRRVVVDIGCGETLGALIHAVEAKVKGTVRLYRLSQAAPHSSDSGNPEVSAYEHSRYAEMVRQSMAKLRSSASHSLSTPSTAIGTLLQILSEQSTEVSRWLSHGDTVYAERLSSSDAEVLAAASVVPSAKASESVGATAGGAQKLNAVSTSPVLSAQPTVATVAVSDGAATAEVAKSVATVRSLRLQQLLQERSLRKSSSSSLRKFVQANTGKTPIPPVPEDGAASEITREELLPLAPALEATSRVDTASVTPEPEPQVPGTTAPATITTGSSVSVKELVARHQSSKSTPSLPELKRSTPTKEIAAALTPTAKELSTVDPVSSESPLKSARKTVLSTPAATTSPALPPRASRRLSVSVDTSGNPSITSAGSDDPELSFPELNFEEIERLNVLGQGRTAVVFRGIWRPTPHSAESGDLSFEVAVKVFSYIRALPPPSVIAAFASELSIMSEMDHPNLVSIIGATTHPRLSIVMPYCSQGTLHGVLRDSSFHLSFLDKCYLAHDISCGLAHLHSKGIIHRDIKSHNVLLDFGPSRLRAMIADFGSTKSLLDGTELAYTEIGTSGWTAPEVFGAHERDAGYGPKADIWSLGVVLWELVVPNPVANRFVGVPAVRYCRELADGVRLELPPETDPLYAQLAQSCWQWKPADRPTAQQIVDKLHETILRLEATV